MFANSQYVPHISCMTFHIVRPRRNTKISREWNFSVAPAENSGVKHGSVFVHNIFAYFHIVFECSPSIHDEKKDVGSPQINFFVWYFPHRTHIFVSLQPISCHPHTQIRIILFHGVRTSIPNWNPSPNRVSTGFSQIASPTTVLPKGVHTMIYAIHVLVDVSQMSGHSDLGIFNHLSASSMFTWV